MLRGFTYRITERIFSKLLTRTNVRDIIFAEQTFSKEGDNGENVYRYRPEIILRFGGVR